MTPVRPTRTPDHRHSVNATPPLAQPIRRTLSEIELAAHDQVSASTIHTIDADDFRSMLGTPAGLRRPDSAELEHSTTYLDRMLDTPQNAAESRMMRTPATPEARKKAAKSSKYGRGSPFQATTPEAEVDTEEVGDSIIQRLAERKRLEERSSEILEKGASKNTASKNSISKTTRVTNVSGCGYRRRFRDFTPEKNDLVGMGRGKERLTEPVSGSPRRQGRDYRDDRSYLEASSKNLSEYSNESRGISNEDTSYYSDRNDRSTDLIF